MNNKQRVSRVKAERSDRLQKGQKGLLREVGRKD